MHRPNYPALLRECNKALAQVKRDIKRLNESKALLLTEKEHLEGLARIKVGLDLIYDQLALPGFGQPVEAKAPHVIIIENILRAYGPLHVKEIANLARMRGVPLNGTKTPAEQVRDKLTNSKRFHLLGGNVWCLPEQQEQRLHYMDGFKEDEATVRLVV